MQEANASLGETLRTMLVSCKEIHEILDKDKEYFIKNNLSSIQKSNDEKNQILVKLNTLAENLKTLCPAGTIEKIEHIEESKLREELQNTLNDLHSTVNACYKALAVNSHIIFTNTQRIKNLWDKLLSLNNASSRVYDHTGAIK